MRSINTLFHQIAFYGQNTLKEKIVLWLLVGVLVTGQHILNVFNWIKRLNKK